MKSLMEGNAIVYCEGAFNTTNGKTAHGLVRFTQRYNINCVIDAKYQGSDAKEIIDGIKGNIPVVGSIDEALEYSNSINKPAAYFVVGLAPDGGRLAKDDNANIKYAIEKGLNVDCGLHDFLTDNTELVSLAKKSGVKIRDIRKTPPRDKLHFFSGKIEKVTSNIIAVLGTDSAIGKRTTAWIFVNSLKKLGHSAVLVGTGQTAWLQGAKYSMIMDSMINDFVSGEIEHAVYSAWENENPEFIIVEGQGSLLNPAYPGGFEILAAGRPNIILLQHAPARKEYDGFAGYKMHSLKKQLKAVEIISGRKVAAITINHENMTEDDVRKECRKIEKKFEIPAFDVLFFGGEKLAKEILNRARV